MVGKDLRTLSSSTTLLRAEAIRAAYSGPCPVKFLISPMMETPQPIWASCASTLSPYKNGFPDVQEEPFVFQFVPTASSPVAGYH